MLGGMSMSTEVDYEDEIRDLRPQSRGMLRSFLESEDEVIIGVREALNDMGSYREVERSDGGIEVSESGILYIETEGKHDVRKSTIEPKDFFPGPRKSITRHYIGHDNYDEGEIKSVVGSGLAYLEEIDQRVEDISWGSAGNTYEYKLPEEDLEAIKSII
jgi:hypothetical protein